MTFQLFAIIIYLLLGLLIYLSSRKHQPDWFMVWMLYISLFLSNVVDWIQSFYG